MKIAIITDVLGIENNGTTITTKRLIENMKNRGHEVFVVSPTSSNEDGYYTLKKRNFLFFGNYIEKKNGVVMAKPDKDLLRKVIEKVDLVHILLPFKTGQAAIKIANELKKPVTTAFHAQAENVTSHFGLKNFKLANDFIYRRFFNKFYRYAKYVHCPSPFIANEIKKHGYNMDLRVISNGVAPVYKKAAVEKPEELKDKFVILFVGRFSKEKRHDILINAVAKSKYKNKIQLIFAGDGPLKNSVIAHGNILPLKPIIKFMPKEELVKIINYTDLYVHPSDIEIEAISCIEAITCGKVPVISDSKRSATNAFALSEKNLFKAGNPLSLAEKIDYFIDHPEEIKKMEQEYASYGQRFQIEYSMNEMEKMFFDAIAANGAQK